MEKYYIYLGKVQKEKRSVFNAYIYRKPPIRNIVTSYIRKERRYSPIYKYCFPYIREILGKVKERAIFPIEYTLQSRQKYKRKRVPIYIWARYKKKKELIKKVIFSYIEKRYLIYI